MADIMQQQQPQQNNDQDVLKMFLEALKGMANQNRSKPYVDLQNPKTRYGTESAEGGQQDPVKAFEGLMTQLSRPRNTINTWPGMPGSTTDKEKEPATGVAEKPPTAATPQAGAASINVPAPTPIPTNTWAQNKNMQQPMGAVSNAILRPPPQQQTYQLPKQPQPAPQPVQQPAQQPAMAPMIPQGKLGPNPNNKPTGVQQPQQAPAPVAVQNPLQALQTVPYEQWAQRRMAMGLPIDQASYSADMAYKRAVLMRYLSMMQSAQPQPAVV